MAIHKAVEVRKPFRLTDFHNAR